MQGGWKRRFLVPLCLAACVMLAACSIFTAHATFTPTMPYTRSTRGPDDILLVFLGNAPTRSFVRVAQLNAGRSDYQNNQDLFDAIRQAAVSSGLDGVADLQSVPGYSYAYQCTGTGFVFQR